MPTTDNEGSSGSQEAGDDGARPIGKSGAQPFGRPGAKARRRPWQALIVGSGLLVIVCSVVLGFWLLAQAISPWAGSVLEIRRIEREGSRTYDTGPRASRISGFASHINYWIRRKEYHHALETLARAGKAGIRSPLFDYLKARVYAEEGDWTTAMRLIDRGNEGGALRLYASAYVSPDRWTWPEFDLIHHLAKAATARSNRDRVSLARCLEFAHRMVWCEPPEAGRLLQASELRRTVARRLSVVAGEDGYPRLAKVCRDLVAESKALRLAMKRKIGREDPFLQGSRAWIIGRTVRDRDSQFSSAAVVLSLEKQAEWARSFRSKYMKIRTLNL